MEEPSGDHQIFSLNMLSDLKDQAIKLPMLKGSLVQVLNE